MECEGAGITVRYHMTIDALDRWCKFDPKSLGLGTIVEDTVRANAPAPQQQSIASPRPETIVAPLPDIVPPKMTLFTAEEREQIKFEMEMEERRAALEKSKRDAALEQEARRAALEKNSRDAALEQETRSRAMMLDEDSKRQTMALDLEERRAALERNRQSASIELEAARQNVRDKSLSNFDKMRTLYAFVGMDDRDRMLLKDDFMNLNSGFTQPPPSTIPASMPLQPTQTNTPTAPAAAADVSMGEPTTQARIYVPRPRIISLSPWLKEHGEKPMKTGDLIRFGTAVSNLWKERNPGKIPIQHDQLIKGMSIKINGYTDSPSDSAVIADAYRSFVRKDK